MPFSLHHAWALVHLMLVQSHVVRCQSQCTKFRSTLSIALVCPRFRSESDRLGHKSLLPLDILSASSATLENKSFDLFLFHVHSFYDVLCASNSISTGALPRPRWESLRRSPDPLVDWEGEYPLSIPQPLDAWGISISAPLVPCPI